jgi:hypothetical protein
MSRCELALEEDALITSEQLEPQGTLWTLKKHKPWIRTQGENLQKNGSEDLCQIKKKCIKRNGNITISRLHTEK